jgi:TrmH family RNA methyltransferase
VIPLSKLTRLPRSQRLRKLLKDFTGAEFRLVQGGELSPAVFSFLEAARDLLAGDEAFPPAAQSALRALCPLPAEPAALRRSLNTVRHILLAETGHFPADWDFTGPRGALDPGKRRVFPGMRVYLEDIRSPFNVGAIFRTAESFGVERLYLSPLSADPLHPRAERTAGGCIAVLPWERLSSSGEALESPPLPGGPWFALETGGTALRDCPFPREGTLLLGSEELGVSPKALAQADASLGRLSIPVWGAKGSLNVTTASGIALHAWAEALGIGTGVSDHCAGGQ